MIYAKFFIDWSFYFVFFQFLLWLHQAWISHGSGIVQLLRRDWRFFFLSFVATGILFLALRVDYKVLSDETNLLSVSRIFLDHQKTANNTGGLYYYEIFHPIVLEVPTRPLLFPLLTAFIHLLFGASDRNPFILNFLLTGLTLYAASVFFRQKTTRLLAIGALAASPVFSLHATSGGFDICSLLFGVFTLLALRSYLGDKESKAKLNTLFFTLLCFMSVRYESLLVAPIVLIALFLARGGKALFRQMAGSLPLLLGLFFLIPLLLQRILTWGHFENPPGVPAFSAAAMGSHFLEFTKSFFSPTESPYLFFFHWLGLLGLGTLILRLRGREEKILFWSVFSALSALLLLVLSHHMGIASHPTQVRVFLPFSAGLLLLGAHWIGSLRPSRWRIAILALALLQIFAGQAYAVRDPLLSQLVLTRETHYLRGFMHGFHSESPLIIYDRPGQFTAFGYGAVDISFASSHSAELKQNLRDGLYSHILVIQHRRIIGREISPNDRLPEIFELRELRNFEVSEFDQVVISEVVP